VLIAICSHSFSNPVIQFASRPVGLSGGHWLSSKLAHKPFGPSESASRYFNEPGGHLVNKHLVYKADIQSGRSFKQSGRHSVIKPSVNQSFSRWGHVISQEVIQSNTVRPWTNNSVDDKVIQTVRQSFSHQTVYKPIIQSVRSCNQSGSHSIKYSQTVKQ